MKKADYCYRVSALKWLKSESQKTAFGLLCEESHELLTPSRPTLNGTILATHGLYLSI